MSGRSVLWKILVERKKKSIFHTHVPVQCQMHISQCFNSVQYLVHLLLWKDQGWWSKIDSRDICIDCHSAAYQIQNIINWCGWTNELNIHSWHSYFSMYDLFISVLIVLVLRITIAQNDTYSNKEVTDIFCVSCTLSEMCKSDPFQTTFHHWLTQLCVNITLYPRCEKPHQ